MIPSRQAIDQMSVQHDAHIRDMQDRAEASNQTEALDGLRRSLAEREDDLEQALREAENGTQQMVGFELHVHVAMHNDCTHASVLLWICI